jgi:hypothetical protein
MRWLRSFVVPVCLCLVLGASAASAAEGPSRQTRRGDAGGVVVRIVRDLQGFLKAFWENEGAQIDPLGRATPGNGGPVQEDPVAPGTDEGCQIDPLG